MDPSLPDSSEAPVADHGPTTGSGTSMAASDLPAADVDQALEAILRGAALLLGCNSATLIVVDPEAGEAFVRLGVQAEQEPLVQEVAQLLGRPLGGQGIPVDNLKGSLVFEAWRAREPRETSSLEALLGELFPADVVASVAQMVGPRRFILLPVLAPTSTVPTLYGLLLFEKGSMSPFSVQQREIMLRYADRIGALMEHDVRRLGAHMAQRPRRGGVAGTAPAAETRGSEDEDSLARRLLLLALGGDHAATLTVDPTFRVTSANEASQRLFGLPAEDIQGRDVGEFFQDAREIHAILNHQFLFRSDGVHEEDVFLRRADGRLTRAVIKALLLADGAQRVLGSLILVRTAGRDGTRRGRDRALARSMRTERLATMGELAAQLAHEIRNPLLGLGATIASLREDPGSPEELDETLALLQAEVARLDAILTEYMSLSVRANASVTALDLAALVEEVLRLQGGAWEARGVRFQTAFASRGRVVGDREGLRQVIVNLLANAVQASPPGGRITVEVADTSHGVRLDVLDEGPGVQGEPRRYFEPFVSTRANGTGLGLAVSERILEAHGGAIRLVNRTDRQGARATVFLPHLGTRRHGPEPTDAESRS